jgi:hypothetical protein
MKREIYIYSILGILTCFLIFYQFSNNHNETEESTSKIQSISELSQLCIDVNCNVFLVEGDGQHILMEGPVKKLKHIQAISNGSCIKITKSTSTFLAGVFRIFESKGNDINIYITLKDLDDIKFSHIDELSSVKFTSSDCMGLILSKGQKLIIES